MYVYLMYWIIKFWLSVDMLHFSFLSKVLCDEFDDFHELLFACLWLKDLRNVNPEQL